MKKPRIWNRHLKYHPLILWFPCDDIELDCDCFERLLEIKDLDDKLVGFNQKNLETFCKAAMSVG